MLREIVNFTQFKFENIEREREKKIYREILT